MKTEKSLLWLCLIVVLTLCMFILPTQADAATVDSGSCGENVTWTLDDTGTLTISGTGPMTNWARRGRAPWSSHMANIKTVNITSGVTTVGAYAFAGTAMTSLNIGNDVTAIYGYAFYRCNNLTGVTIPDNVTLIGGYAFKDSGLVSISIGNGVTSMGHFAFMGCDELVYNRFGNALYLGNDKTPYLVLVAAKNTDITSYQIHSDTKLIACGAFSGCSMLTQLTIPASIVSIGYGAFENCDQLRDVYYRGSMKQWNEIGTEEGNASLVRALMHFGEDSQYGWLRVANNWYCNYKGDPVIGWLSYGFNRYYFRADGAMAVGWLQLDGKWYYFNQNGAMKTGWLQSGENWYLLDKNGVMLTGWQYRESDCYYLHADGKMHCGWLLEDGIWHYFDKLGRLYNGWVKAGNDWYYTDWQGHMVTGEVMIGGERHLFDNEGVWIEQIGVGRWVCENGKWYYYQFGMKHTGWMLDGGSWYFLDKNGAMVTGWQKIGSYWYHFKETGEMESGWLQIGMGWCYYRNCKKVTGWQLIDEEWYYFNQDGKMHTGWLKQGNVWYYLRPNGMMAVGTRRVYDTIYHFDDNGVCLNP